MTARDAPQSSDLAPIHQSQRIRTSEVAADHCSTCVQVKYSVKQSKYKINPWTWEATITYVAGQAQASIGVKSLWDKFVAHGVVSALHAQHALGTYLPGWFQLSVDFLVDLD